MDFRMDLALGVVVLDPTRACGGSVWRAGRGSDRVVDALDALCRREGGALARLKAATQAYVTELSDRSVPCQLAVDAVTDLVVACWFRGTVPAPAPLVREALVDVVASWCVDELGRNRGRTSVSAIHRVD